MATFKQLQDQTIAEVVNLLHIERSVLSREMVKVWINEAYDEIASVLPWPWSLSEDTDTLTAEDAELSVPADFVTMLSVFNVTRNYEMFFIDSRQAWTEDETTHTGNPTHYRRVGDSWYVWPTPAEADVIKMRYYASWTALSSDSDVPVIPGMFHDILKYFAVARAFEWLNATSEEDLPTAQAGQALYNRRFTDALANMKASWATDETLDTVHSHVVQQDVINYQW